MLWTLPLLALAALLFWGYISSNLILKLDRMALDANPKTFGHEFETFRTPTEDGVDLEGWFVRSQAKTQATLVVLHGWGANRSDVLPSTIFLARHFHLLYFDFRNHGNSGGTRTSLTCAEIKDLVAALAYLKGHHPAESKQIGLYGFSMGASVALAGAAQIPEVRAVAAESPFSSFNRIVARFAELFFGIPQWAVPWTLLCTRWRLGFDAEECSPLHHIADIAPRPVLLIQGGSDARMPPAEGRALYEAARQPKELWVAEGADHGEAAQKYPEEYRKRLLDFFQKWVRP